MSFIYNADRQTQTDRQHLPEPGCTGTATGTTGTGGGITDKTLDASRDSDINQGQSGAQQYALQRGHLLLTELASPWLPNLEMEELLSIVADRVE